MLASTRIVILATEMRTRLSDLFEDSQGGPIEVDGQLVHMMYEFPPIESPARLRVRMRPSSERPQALNMKARHGTVLINDQELDNIGLWTDTAPPEIVAGLRPSGGKRPMNLRVWNGWRDHRGNEQSWIGDAGMLIEDHGDGRVTLRCSDGYDRPSFDDLVVELALEPAG